MSLHSWICILSLFFSLLFFWKLHRCENVCISRWQGKKENKPQPFLYTKLQGGWQNSSLNALWCCLFERSEPSPALWSGFPAHMPLQMLFSLVPTSSSSFSVSFYFYLLCHSWDPPVAVACPPGSFVKLRPLCFEVLQHDQYEVESGSWSVYCCVFTVKVHVIMGRR